MRKYKEFLKKNKTFEERVEALTSGILSPDTKAVSLWAMNPNRFYSSSELYSEVRSFSGGSFPVTERAVWQYCNENSPCYDGCFFNIGAVVKLHCNVKGTFGKWINISLEILQKILREL
jgi:hypothetical protein